MTEMITLRIVDHAACLVENGSVALVLSAKGAHGHGRWFPRVLAMLLILVSLTATQTAKHGTFRLSKIPACDSAVYCSGPLLQAVQNAHIFNDSKTFVDMEMKEDPDVILAAYHKLTEETPYPSKADLEAFLHEHFTGPGDELEKCFPSDWKENPKLIERIKDEELRKWARSLHKLWPKLCRKVKKDVYIHPDRHSLLYAPYPFIIPGQRFREFYYWDSYWIIKGLLVSGMQSTVEGILENFLFTVDRLGFIPNGGRVYLARRSQPPLLIPAVDAYYEATKNISFIKANIALMEKEYRFWVVNRTTQVEKNGKTYSVARYNVNMTLPRPEGFREDEQTIEGMSSGEAEEVLGDIAAACESGWDFSSRWLSQDDPHHYSLKSVRTKYIVPVDLNSYLCLNEQILAKFYHLIGKTDKETQYLERARERERMTSELLWNETLGAWFDYDMKTKKQNVNFYPSNVWPMFAGCYGHRSGSRKEFKEAKVVKYLQEQGIMDWPGGIPTSKIRSGQQWDCPDAWPPLVHLLTSALSQAALPVAKQMAFNLTQRWLRSNWLAWKRTGKMFEKYDAAKQGEAGGGGEYDVQEGFGWTNGVVLQMLADYGHQANVVSNQSGLVTDFTRTTMNPIYVVLDVFALCFLIGVFIKAFCYCRRSRLHYVKIKEVIYK